MSPFLSFAVSSACNSSVLPSLSAGDVDEAAQSLCKLLVALGEHSAHYLALNLALPEVQTFFTLMLGFSSLPGYYGLDEDVSEVRPFPLRLILYRTTDSYLPLPSPSLR